jgi:hypothetical protein
MLVVVAVSSFVWVGNLICSPKRRIQSKVFENRVLRGMFGPEIEEGTGGWRKLHHKDLRNLYSSTPNINMLE